MKTSPNVGLKDVQAVYSGPEGDLWELLMGEQIHLGGLQSSMELADKAGITAGMHGIDLCCCSGAGMRFLVRLRNVAGMRGVDATPHVVRRGRQRCKREGLDREVRFTLADVCRSRLPSESADFVWGEDAWCYVVDKPKLISEAFRLVKPGGVIAFTDWLEGPERLPDEEADRFLGFMKFPNLFSLSDYRQLLAGRGCQLAVCEHTDRFAPCMDLYINMLNTQLTYDALRIIGFDSSLMRALGAEMAFIQQLAHARKISQGIFVARKGR
jgi:ubiquinone/menaquinone biosynthesis C-methylase UbiE